MKRLLLFALLYLILTPTFAETPPDTFVWLIAGTGVDTLDPAQAYDDGSYFVLQNIYERLYAFTGESLDEYEPALGTSYKVSDNGLTYTFTLREGVTFHSGNPFTCRDVEYSIERLLVTSPADAAGWYFAESLLGTPDNANEALGEDASEADFNAYWGQIDTAVTCLDDYTVQFKLPKADASFFAKLVSVPASIVDSQWAIENGAWSGTNEDWRDWVGVDLRQGYLQEHASGTGAYTFVSLDSESLVAERFDNYWGKLPALKRVLQRSVEDPAARIEALRQSDADIIQINRALMESQVRGMSGVKVWENNEWASTSVFVLVFNFDIQAEDNPLVGSGKLDGEGIPPEFFTDINVRKGFAYSIDLATVIEELSFNKGVQLTMALPPSFPGYDPELSTYQFDLDKAEAHFREAWNGELWENGFKLTLITTPDFLTRQTIMEIIKANIEALNPKFQIDIQVMNGTEVFSAFTEGKVPFDYIGFFADYADPDNFIYNFYHSKGGVASYIAFTNPEMDQLVEQARTTNDLNVRAHLYSQIGQLGYELLPFVPTYINKPFIVTRDNVEGIYYNPMIISGFLWKDVSKR